MSRSENAGDFARVYDGIALTRALAAGFAAAFVFATLLTPYHAAHQRHGQRAASETVGSFQNGGAGVYEIRESSTPELSSAPRLCALHLVCSSAAEPDVMLKLIALVDASDERETGGIAILSAV